MEEKCLFKVVLLLGSNLPLGRLSPEQIIAEADKEIIDALLPDYLEVEALEDAVSATEITVTDPCGKRILRNFTTRCFPALPTKPRKMCWYRPRE